MGERPAWTEKFQSLAYGVIRVVGAGIFLYLTYYSLRYSQYMFPGTREYPIDMIGKPACNIAAALILCAAVLGSMQLEKKLTERNKLWLERIFLVGSLLWIACCSFWWSSTLDRIPEGDQAFVYGGASYFLEGNFVFLAKGAYCGNHPYQLGLIAIVELLFLLVGTYNYYAFEIICAVMAVGIAFLGYCLLKELETPFGARIVYCVLIMGCIPLICYTSWVYGDIPSIFFAMLIAWLAVRWSSCPKNRYLAGIAASAVMAMLVRRTSMVLLIALAILAVVHMIRCRKWQIGVTVLLAALCSFLAYQGIYKMYEARSGIEHCEGIPTNSWIAMGMMEQEGRCGWYNNMELSVMYSVDNEPEAAKAIMAQYIAERWDTFQSDPEYARWFLKRKVLSQWNDPLYQSVYFSAKSLEESPPKPGSFLERLYYLQETHDRVLQFADVMQFLVYLGMLFYFLFAVRKDTEPLACLLSVTIIGGFFLSIIWEAKARYIFPYYVMMYPLAVMGYFRAGQLVMAFGQKILKSHLVRS